MILDSLKEIKKEIHNTRSIIVNQLMKGINLNDVRVAFFEILYDTVLSGVSHFKTTILSSYFGVRFLGLEGIPD